jgi:hypothetical protein
MGSLGRFAELALWDAIHVELAIDQAGYGMSDRNVDLTLVVFASDYLEDLRDCLAALTRQLPDSLVYQTVVVIGARGEPIDFSGWAVPPHLRWVRASDEDLGSPGGCGCPRVGATAALRQITRIGFGGIMA